MCDDRNALVFQWINLFFQSVNDDVILKIYFNTGLGPGISFNDEEVPDQIARILRNIIALRILNLHRYEFNITLNNAVKTAELTQAQPISKVKRLWEEGNIVDLCQFLCWSAKNQG